MRKLTRSEKTKLIEKAKTLIIALLFFLCLFLGYRILRLYNAQANVEGALWGSNSSGAINNIDNNQYPLTIISELPHPEIMVINGPQGRTLIEASNRIFNNLASLGNQIIGELYTLRSDEVLNSSKDEWENATQSNSIYIKYPVERFSDFETVLYGLKDNSLAGKIKSYTKVLLSIDPKTPDITVFVLDHSRGNIIKSKLSTDAANAICESAKELANIQKKEYVFAHELNLDKPAGRDRATLDSMILISAEEEKASEIKVIIPKVYKAGLNFTKATDLTMGLINTFGYNPNTIRQYVSSDDSLMFVGETGSLILHPQGLIEYKALDAEDGIVLDKAGDGDLKSIMLNLCEMLERIMRISGINTNNADFTVKITNLPEAYRSAAKTEIAFDYFVDSKRIEFSDSYGIQATIENGNLVELKVQLKDIEKQNKQSFISNQMTAINDFYAKNKDYKKISNVYMVYKYKEANIELNAEWKIEGAK